MGLRLLYINKPGTCPVRLCAFTFNREQIMTIRQIVAKLNKTNNSIHAEYRRSGYNAYTKHGGAESPDDGPY